MTERMNIKKLFSPLWRRAGGGDGLVFPRQKSNGEKPFPPVHLVFDAAELPGPAGVVQKRPQVEPVVVRAVALGVVRGRQRGHFVSVQGILGEKPLHFVGHLGGEGHMGPGVSKAGKPPGQRSQQHRPGQLTASPQHPQSAALGLPQRQEWTDAAARARAAERAVRMRVPDSSILETA